MNRIGFIGAGHICEILISNLLERGGFSPENLFVSDPDTLRVAKIKEMFGVGIKEGNDAVVSACDIVFICVRPNIVSLILKNLSQESVNETVIISVTAGAPIPIYENAFPNAKIVRILPNPPSRIRQGVVPVAYGRHFTADDKKKVSAVIGTLGPCFEVGEDKIDIFTSVTSPAPVYAFFEAMIDAAVLCGLDAKTASEMVQQTIRGCLMMWEKDGNDIHRLIVEACTPGGTSVESLRVMDKGAFRSTMKEAYYAAWQKSREFGIKD